MSEILGHDVDGRPLRAGDRVVIVDGKPSFLRNHPVGTETTVIEFDGFRGVNVDLKPPPGFSFVAVAFTHLRRIDDRPELGSWDEIEKITGWNPTKQPVEA